MGIMILIKESCTELSKWFKYAINHSILWNATPSNNSSCIMHVAGMDPIQALMAILHCLLSAMWAGPAAEENPLGVQHRHCTQVPGGTEGKERGRTVLPSCSVCLFLLSQWWCFWLVHLLMVVIGLDLMMTRAGASVSLICFPSNGGIWTQGCYVIV